jgi:NADH:ubiquinone oxidoreductase subunit 3 (subunit A)
LQIILTPPLAFLIYIPLITLLLLFGRKLAAPGKPNDLKTSIYASGQQASTNAAAPGYRPFFLVAFFFAFLHLGMLVLGTGTVSIPTAIYLVGLILGLVALILG